MFMENKVLDLLIFCGVHLYVTDSLKIPGNEVIMFSFKLVKHDIFTTTSIFCGRFNITLN